MDKLTIATQVLLKLIETDKTGFDAEGIAAYSFEIADAMQAEADKRINRERPDVLLTKDKDGNCLHFHREFGRKKCMDCGASLEEWQPDWSQAPDWAAYWIKTSGGSSAWLETKPRISSVSDSWVLESIKKSMALSFGYAGTWQDSLRKRPEALCEVDWSVAPQDTTGWKIKEGRAYWIDSDGWIIEDAPSFGFTGTHIMERPNGF